MVTVLDGLGNYSRLIARLAERQKERDALVAEIGSADTLHQIHVDRKTIEAKVQAAVAAGKLIAGALLPTFDPQRELTPPERSIYSGKSARRSWPRSPDGL